MGGLTQGLMEAMRPAPYFPHRKDTPPMTTHIALLRAVNVGGNNRIAMADLRKLLADLEFGDPRSLLQSGNLVFESDGHTPAEIERRLETETEKRLGARPDFLVRTAAEWRKIIARNPFDAEAKNDPGHLVILFLKSAPRAAAVAALKAAIAGREVVEVDGRQAYVTYPDGIGRSKLTNALLERKLGTSATGRNWNTVLKLGALAKA